STPIYTLSLHDALPIFTMQQVLKPEQREGFREAMKEVSGAINAGKSPLLEGGMDAKTIGINPKDAQLLESRAFSVEEICRWFRRSEEHTSELQSRENLV